MPEVFSWKILRLCSLFHWTFYLVFVEFLEWIRYDTKSFSLQVCPLLLPSAFRLLLLLQMSTSQPFLSWLPFSVFRSFSMFRSFSKKSGKMHSSIFLPSRRTKAQNEWCIPCWFHNLNQYFSVFSQPCSRGTCQILIPAQPLTAVAMHCCRLLG